MVFIRLERKRLSSSATMIQNFLEIGMASTILSDRIQSLKWWMFLTDGSILCRGY